jgi:hypothetical protein
VTLGTEKFIESPEGIRVIDGVYEGTDHGYLWKGGSDESIYIEKQGIKLRFGFMRIINDPF